MDASIYGKYCGLSPGVVVASARKSRFMREAKGRISRREWRTLTGGKGTGSVAEDDRGLQLIYVLSVTRAFVRKRARHRCATPAILREAGHEFPASSVRPRNYKGTCHRKRAKTSRPGVRVVDLSKISRERKRILDIEKRSQLQR